MDKLEKIIGFVYRKRKAIISAGIKEHPSEEALGAFMENKLSGREKNILQEHLVNCEICAKNVALAIRVNGEEPLELPQDLLLKADGLLDVDSASVLDLVLRLKDDVWEIIQANAAVLLGDELIPVPVLRGRSISNFKDEVTVLKEFDLIRVEAKVSHKGGKKFNIAIMIKDKKTHRPFNDLRISLIQDDVELESHANDSGNAIFEDVLIGKYKIEILRLKEILATVHLEVRN